MSANASNSLSQYLEQLRGTTFQRLYQQPSTVFAIFRRMLPHLGMLHVYIGLSRAPGSGSWMYNKSR